jgi:uncharacterized protein
MIGEQHIIEFADEIAHRYSPHKIVLFGSQATGVPNEDSDVDLLIVMDFEGRRTRKAAEILCAIDPPFPVDLFLRTPEEIRHRLEIGDYFMKSIIAEGRTLYDGSVQAVA